MTYDNRLLSSFMISCIRKSLARRGDNIGCGKIVDFEI